jgi:hypothetical protein
VGALQMICLKGVFLGKEVATMVWAGEQAVSHSPALAPRIIAAVCLTPPSALPKL